MYGVESDYVALSQYRTYLLTQNATKLSRGERERAERLRPISDILRPPNGLRVSGE